MAGVCILRNDPVCVCVWLGLISIDEDTPVVYIDALFFYSPHVCSTSETPYFNPCLPKRLLHLLYSYLFSVEDTRRQCRLYAGLFEYFHEMFRLASAATRHYWNRYRLPHQPNQVMIEAGTRPVTVDTVQKNLASSELFDALRKLDNGEWARFSSAGNSALVPPCFFRVRGRVFREVFGACGRGED